MYVYYETHKFAGAFYTHRVTVHENATGRLCEKLQAQYGRKAVSWNLKRRRVYVRETLRIARLHQSKPRNSRTKHFGEWHFATSRNFALSIYARIDLEDGVHEQRCGRTSKIVERLA